jgi:hypothetical protein
METLNMQLNLFSYPLVFLAAFTKFQKFHWNIRIVPEV